MYLTLRCFEME